ncbi:hypothetical protein HID58_012942, partial [Brassica napus]
PNQENPRKREASPPHGQPLRLRRRPRFETTPGNQPSIHPDPPELTDFTPSPPQTSSTQVNPKAERINRLFEISSDAIHHNHREEGFTRTITVNHGRASNVLRRRRHQSKPKPNRKNKTNPKTELGKQQTARQGKERFHPPLHLTGTGTGVDEARRASASRRQNQKAEQRASPRLPQNHRALTPETETPHAAFFQSSGKAEERGDDSKAKSTAEPVA